MTTKDAQEIKAAVQETYAQLARRFVEPPAKATSSCCEPAPAEEESCCPSDEAEETPSAETSASCCDPAVTASEHALRLYSGEEIAGLPETVTGAVAGCGNPTAIAELQPGEVVLDLGSGGGIDCFLAAKKVGPTGRVIGLDMTPDMIRLARRNAKKVGATNIEFRFGEMEDIPLPDASVDVVISNCVINLSPDKAAVFSEIERVLRPGGRMIVSDIVIHGELPQSIRESMSAWAGCIAGALDESVYLDRIRTAGLESVEVLSRDFAELSAAEGEDVKAIIDQSGLDPKDLDHTIASVKVRAYKPV